MGYFPDHHTSCLLRRVPVILLADPSGSPPESPPARQSAFPPACPPAHLAGWLAVILPASQPAKPSLAKKFRRVFASFSLRRLRLALSLSLSRSLALRSAPLHSTPQQAKKQPKQANYPLVLGSAWRSLLTGCHCASMLGRDLRHLNGPLLCAFFIARKVFFGVCHLQALFFPPANARPHGPPAQPLPADRSF